MKFVDPCSVICPNCQECHEYALDELLKLKASCKTCGYDLSSIGQKMNTDIDNWSLFVLRVELALKLEESFAVDFKDEELEKLNTLGEVVQLTISKVASSYDYEQIRQQVYEATAEVGEISTDQLQLDMSLLEALCSGPRGC